MSVAHEFMTWIDTSISPSPRDFLALHWILARLQVSVIELPAVVPEEHSSAVTLGFDEHYGRFTTLTNRFEGIGLNSYRTSLFPLDDKGELIVGSLADYMADIYHDLEKGLAYARDSCYSDAVWEWRFGYFSHWGYHLADAQTALRQYLDQQAAPWFEPPRS
jgi:hypothetical protein